MIEVLKLTPSHCFDFLYYYFVLLLWKLVQPMPAMTFFAVAVVVGSLSLRFH